MRKIYSITALFFAALLLQTGCGKSENLKAKWYVGPFNEGTVLKEPKEEESEETTIDVVSVPMQLNLTVDEAIMIALKNNRELSMKRIDPLIKGADERIAQSEFDPFASASVSRGKTKGRSAGSDHTSDTADLSASIKKKFTTGMTVEVEAFTSITDSSAAAAVDAQSRIGVSITQALLNGFGIGVNKAEITSARIDTDISTYELRGYVLYLVSAIEKTYWTYALSLSNIGIYEDSLEIARKQQYETSEKIKAGTLPKIDLPAAQAEVALRQEDLINARSSAEVIRLRFLRLLNAGGDTNWSRTISIQEQPAVPEFVMEKVENYVKLAFRLRPDLNQARLQIRKGDVEVVRTKNGLLPKLDLFINMGRSGYSDSFGGSIKGLNDDYYDIEAGLSLTYPNAGAPGARYKKARLSLRKANLSLKNMEDLVELDVRTAYIEVLRAKEQVAATEATRKSQEEKLRAEIEKFGVGRSTTILVAQAQRDFVESRIAEKEAVVNILRALIDFRKTDGSLLDLRGVQAPGKEEVKSD